MDARTPLKDLPRAELLAWAHAHGIRPGQADRLWGALYQRLVADPADIPDLDAPLRARLADLARFDALAVDAIHSAERRHPQAGPSDSRRRRDRVGDDPRGHRRRRPRHPVHLEPGRLRDELPVLPDRQDGPARHLTTAEMVDQVVLARRLFPDTVAVERRVHGHGRAAAQPRQRDRRDPHPVRRPRPRPVAPPRHRLDLGDHPRDPAATSPPRRPAWPSASTPRPRRSATG
jgi:hypothetical protein